MIIESKLLRNRRIKCKHCDFRCAFTDNLKQMRDHNSNKHKGQPFRKESFVDKNKFIKLSLLKVNSNTLSKRISRAKQKCLSNYQPRQCRHMKANGEQCRRILSSGAVKAADVRCHFHPLKDASYANKHCMYKKGDNLPHLECKRSLIPDSGNGVFVGKYWHFQPGDILTEMSGEFMDTTQIKNKNYSPSHTIKCGGHGFSKPYLSGITVLTEGKGFGSFVNRGSRRPDQQKNAEFVFLFSNTEREGVYLRVTQLNGPEQEIYTSYGSGFRL
jgi:hypothetical protein